LSSKPKGISAYRLDVLANDIVHLMDALGYSKTLLVGHDWGGAVAWAMAALHPERVERLVIMDSPYPPVVFRSMLAHPAQLRKSAYIFAFQFPGIAEARLGKDNWKALVNSLRRTSPPGTFTPDDFDYYRDAWDQKDAMTSMLNWYRALIRRPTRLPADPHLKMPALVIWGENDFALGRELAEASIKACDNGNLVIFEGANHWIQREEAEKINQQLLIFFEGQFPVK
jgi:pimeloyl-ACP methyl ester carboxylesterase